MSSKKKAPAGAGRRLEKPAAAKPAKMQKVIATDIANPAARAETRPAEERTEELADAFAGMQASFANAGLGILVVNGTLLAMMRQNVGAGLDLARKLARAETPLHSMQLHLAYWREQSSVFAAQARELHELSSELMSGAGGR